MFSLRGLPWSNRVMDFIPQVDADDLDLLNNLEWYDRVETRFEDADMDGNYDFILNPLKRQKPRS